MINTKSVEIITHLLKTLPPPGKIIFLHGFPVIGRKTPVLSFCCKCIGWCTSLLIHVIEPGFNPCIYTVSANANRYITFNNNAVFMRIFCSIFQLQVQVKLSKIMHGNFIIMLLLRAYELLHFTFIINCISFPVVKFSRFIFISQISKSRIGLQPVAITFKKIDVN